MAINGSVCEEEDFKSQNREAYMGEMRDLYSSFQSCDLHIDLEGKTVDLDGGPYQTLHRDTPKAGKFPLAQLFRSPVNHRT